MFRHLIGQSIPSVLAIIRIAQRWDGATVPHTKSNASSNETEEGLRLANEPNYPGVPAFEGTLSARRAESA